MLYQRLIRQSTITFSGVIQPLRPLYQRLIRQSTITDLSNNPVLLKLYQRLIRQSTITSGTIRTPCLSVISEIN